MKTYPIPLQPMNFSGIFDNAFKIYRKNWKTILPVSLLVGGVFMFIMMTAMYLQAVPLFKQITYENYKGAIGPFAPDFFASGFWNSMLWFGVSTCVLSFINALVITPFVTYYVSRVSSSYFHGEKMDMKIIARQSAAGVGKLILTVLAGTLLYIGVVFACFAVLVLLALGTEFISPFIGILLFLVFFPVILIFIIFALVINFSIQITVHEDICGFKAIARSMKMIFRKFWFSIGVTLAASLLVQMAVGAGGGIFGFFVVISSVFLIIGSLVISAIYAVATPFVYIVYTLLYLDLKIEHENYYLTLMMEDNQPG